MPNVLSPRDLVSRPDMDETVLHTYYHHKMKYRIEPSSALDTVISTWEKSLVHTSYKTFRLKGN